MMLLACASAPSVLVGTPVVRTLRLPPPRMCTPAPDPVQPVFDNLLQSPGVQGDAVQLQRGAFGRSLVASRAVEAGEVLLSVPLSLCLTTHRSGVCGGLMGQTDAMWEAAGDLREEVGEGLYQKGATWDVRLALLSSRRRPARAARFGTTTASCCLRRLRCCTRCAYRRRCSRSCTTRSWSAAPRSAPRYSPISTRCSRTTPCTRSPRATCRWARRSIACRRRCNGPMAW